MYACQSRCATPEGREAAKTGQMPPDTDTGRRRVQQVEGSSIPGQYVLINGNRTFVPPLTLPTIEALIDADCLQWATPAKGRSHVEHPTICLRYAHKYPRLNALLVRHRMLMHDPVVKSLLKDGGRGIDLGGGRRGSDVLTEIAGKVHKLAYTSRGGLSTRRRKGFGSWAGHHLEHLTEAAAEAIGDIGDFFSALDGDFDVIGEYLSLYHLTRHVFPRSHRFDCDE